MANLFKVHFKIGDAFFLRSCDNIGDLIGAFYCSFNTKKWHFYFVEKEQDTLSAEVSKYEAERSNITGKMDSLKKQLYAKFGDQIHLERE